ncbi:twin-arginine translocase subunit TatC [Pelosinus baikalensis]|uniref:twin-arginine translocase subunit TatC n=1 Tax=Pelosinus baikalensis TaxID=2892015 RepID=UPI001E4B2D35|nr:twin-arginine translocase subunit TatC [Pelosinus baikalensis]
MTTPSQYDEEPLDTPLSATPSSVVLFFIGILFSYFFVLPAGIQFFLNFATESLQPMFFR